MSAAKGNSTHQSDGGRGAIQDDLLARHRRQRAAFDVLLLRTGRLRHRLRLDDRVGQHGLAGTCRGVGQRTTIHGGETTAVDRSALRRGGATAGRPGVKTSVVDLVLQRIPGPLSAQPVRSLPVRGEDTYDGEMDVAGVQAEPTPAGDA